MTKKHLLVEGWRGVNHSIALVNQHQLLELVRRPSLRLSHRDTRGDGSGLFVREDDKPYLRNKWRPEGAHQFVEMDVSTDQIRATLVGEGDSDWFGSWTSSIGQWIGPRTAEFVFNYIDQFSGHPRANTFLAEFAADGSKIVDDGSADYQTTKLAYDATAAANATSYTAANQASLGGKTANQDAAAKAAQAAAEAQAKQQAKAVAMQQAMRARGGR